RLLEHLARRLGVSVRYLGTGVPGAGRSISLELEPLHALERGTGMPRIQDSYLNSVVYLYGAVEDARAGERSGGTGFLISTPPSTKGGPHFVYAVTNSHVIREGGASVIRVNALSEDLQTDVISLGADAWYHHVDGDDIAVCPLGLSPHGWASYS